MGKPALNQRNTVIRSGILPKFTVSYTVDIHHLNGQVKVEAETAADAITKVQEEEDLERLLDGCSDQETTVDAWVGDRDDGEAPT